MKHALTFGLLIPTAACASPRGQEGFSDALPFQHMVSLPDRIAPAFAARPLVARWIPGLWVHK